MTPRRIANSLAGALLLTAGLAGCTAEPEAAPNSPSATASPTPTATPTFDGIAPTCENTSTAVFQTEMANRGWVATVLPSESIGSTPFDSFPNGASSILISCRWAANPEIPTDDILDVAWAPIGALEAAAAQEQLAGVGFERIDTPEGVYLAIRGDESWSDDDGYAQTYLFTADDVRWATFKEAVRYVKAPDEAG